MKVFVTGASGWIASALIPELVASGHQVLGLARSDGSAATVAQRGAAVLRGELGSLDVLRAGAEASDAVVHLAFIHDFTDMHAAVKADAEAIRALGAALEGSGKPLVIASGTPVVPGHIATERDRNASDSPAAGREANAQALLDMVERGVRSVVVRLPRSVHGEGDRHGFIARLIAIARERGVSGYVGDGSSRWPAVHVLDAARLFRLAVELAEAGSVLHAVGDEAVRTGEIAEVIGSNLGVPTAAVPAEQFGFLGRVLAGDQPASSALTRKLVPWRPTEPGLIEDLGRGHYFA